MAYEWSKEATSLVAGMNEIQTNVQERRQTVSDPFSSIKEALPTRRLWRIKNYQCITMPYESYGDFYMKDVLLFADVEFVPGKKKKDPPSAQGDVFLWVGKLTSVQEYATAIYYLSELDSLLRGTVTLHREVQGFESPPFRQFFKTLTYWTGNFDDSYFMTKVKSCQYSAKLLKLYKPNLKPRQLVAKEVHCKLNELDPAFTFVLDLGYSLYLWHGNLTPTEDDMKSIEYVESIRLVRGADVVVHILDDDTKPDQHPFYTYLSRSDEHVIETESHLSHLHKKNRQRKNFTWEPQLLRQAVRKSTTKPTFEILKTGSKISKKDIEKYPVSILSCAEAVVIFVNTKNLTEICSKMFTQAQEYLSQTEHPHRCVSIVRQNQLQRQTALLPHYLGADRHSTL